MRLPMFPKMDNCSNCDADMTQFPYELRHAHCWVFCPDCWINRPKDKHTTPEIEEKFLEMCKRLSVKVVKNDS